MSGKGVRRMEKVCRTDAERDARLTQLMETHGTSVLRVCLLYLHDHALAQDAAQNTFLKAWQALHTLRSSETERSWLMAIAINTCRTMLRSPEYRLYARSIDLTSLPEPASDAHIPDRTVTRAVLSLPTKYREVVILHYYQTLPTPDIARALRIPAATVRTRLQRARKLLEPMLKGWYLSDE